jgi:hypothetical protein
MQHQCMPNNTPVTCYVFNIAGSDLLRVQHRKHADTPSPSTCWPGPNSSAYKQQVMIGSITLLLPCTFLETHSLHCS